MGEVGGELPEYAREAASTRGRPCLSGRNFLQIQELRESCLVSTKKGAGLLTMAVGLELARGTKMTEQIEKIKTRQHHPCFSEFKHTLLRMKPPMMGRKQDR